DKAGEVEGPLVPGELGLAADGVAVVEDLGSGVEEADHGHDVGGHRLAGSLREAFGVFGAHGGHVLEGDAPGEVRQRVVGGGLVGDDVDGGAHHQQARDHIGGVAEQPDGERFSRVAGGDGAADRIVDVGGLLV